MLKSIKTAYGAGWRAGYTRRPLLVLQDGTKRQIDPINPYLGWAQVLQRIAYKQGVDNGTIKRIYDWKRGRSL
jgi:hypothetical protein